MLEIGSVVDGKYKILNKIGQGGMSVVYLAMNEKANKQWAIKEVRKDGVSNYEVVKQGLIVETDLLKKLNHSHLPSIIDVIDGDGTFLIVMDYIEGNPLNNTLGEYGAQHQDDVITWAKQLCDVLGYLHSREPPIVYRDMKPSNVMLKPDGNVMLIDFGTAREFKSSSVEDTTCLGTQGYAAPEQFGGRGQTDARTDVYCLGATLYHLVTGHNPCDPPYEMYPIRQWNPNLSSGLEEIILKCTQRNPEDRYQSCAELLYALEHYNELDIEYKRAQKWKWIGFVASTMLTVAAAAGAIGFRAAANSQMANSYDAYIEAARSSEEAQAADYFKRAINLNPSNIDAYQALLEYIQGDNEFTLHEDEYLRAIFNENNGKSRSNIEYLKINDPEAYEELAYHLGNAYFYIYKEANYKAKAQTWFEIAAASAKLDEKKVARAQCLGKIAGYYATLGQKNQAGDASTPYRDYWTDLETLIGSELLSADNKVTALRSYKDFVNNLFLYGREFMDEGISQEDMVRQLERVKAGVEGMALLSDDTVELALKEEVLVTMEQTRKNINSLFAGTVQQTEKGEE